MPSIAAVAGREETPAATDAVEGIAAVPGMKPSCSHLRHCLSKSSAAVGATGTCDPDVVGVALPAAAVGAAFGAGAATGAGIAGAVTGLAAVQYSRRMS